MSKWVIVAVLVMSGIGKASAISSDDCTYANIHNIYGTLSPADHKEVMRQCEMLQAEYARRANETVDRATDRNRPRPAPSNGCAGRPTQGEVCGEP